MGCLPLPASLFADDRPAPDRGARRPVNANDAIVDAGSMIRRAHLLYTYAFRTDTGARVAALNSPYA